MYYFFMAQNTAFPAPPGYHFFESVDTLAISSDESSLSYHDHNRQEKKARFLKPRSVHHARDHGFDSSPLSSSSESAANDAWSESDCSSSSGRSKSRARKQERPRRSAAHWDPSFRGVAVKFKTEMKEGQAKLSIDASYHGDFLRRHRRRLDGRRHAQEAETKQISTAKIISNPVNTGKQCASCGTKRTPLWRDAEDGTPLCNACGIRYKKYRLRCTHCWHIPKKDAKVLSHCSHCGHLLKLAIFKYRIL